MGTWLDVKSSARFQSKGRGERACAWKEGRKRAGFRGALTIARNFQMNGARGAKKDGKEEGRWRWDASVLARIDPGGKIDPLREEGEMPQLRP